MIAFLFSLIVAVATPDARVVEIHAKRFSFTPDTVTLQQGERVTIRLIADDRAHGLLVKPLGVDLDRVSVDQATRLEPGQSLRITKFLAFGWSSIRSRQALRDQWFATMRKD